jgi:hypothetical protein
MIQPQRRQAGAGCGGQDVGGVQAPAQARFDHAGIGGHARKREEQRRRGHFKEAGRQVRLGRVERFLEQVGQHGIVDQPAGQADALVVAHQMRLGGGVNTQALRFEHEAQVGAGGALAVGAGNVEHRRQAILRIAQPRAEFAHGVQPQPPLRQRQCAQPVKLGLHGRVVGNREVLHETALPSCCLLPDQAALAAIR